MSIVSLPKHGIHAGNLILVNREYGLSGIDTNSLVPVWEHCNSIQMQRRAVVLLSSLMDKIQGWRNIVPVSGWRSFGEQQEIWENTVRGRGFKFAKKYVAFPGHSEHQTGLAIDLGLKKEHIDFVCPDFPYSGICQTFRRKATNYGFIERYPARKEHITGIGHEPWHFRYVGVPHAEIMVRNNLTLEEYISFIKKYSYGQDPYGIQLEGQDVYVSYLKAAPTGDLKVEIDESYPYSISGNNTDGFIMTEWRQAHGHKRELWRA